MNFKSRTDCRRCATPRNQPRPTNSPPNTATIPQAPRSGDWMCQFCQVNNFASRQACYKCHRNKPEPVSVNPSTITKPGDWICSFCSNNNFAARIACYKCNRPKAVPMATASAQAVSKPGDWKCSSCPETNFGSRVVCRNCGSARPSDEKKAEENKSECVICMDQPIDSVITTCGHSAVCLACGSTINQCPICRNPFTREQLIKLYIVH